MIFGAYPCCKGSLTFAMPDRSPAYMPEDCPHCGLKVWHRLSRVQSTSWVEADFLREFDVDEQAKTVTPRPGTEAERFDQMNRELGEAVAAGAIDLSDAMITAAMRGAVEDLLAGR